MDEIFLKSEDNIRVAINHYFSKDRNEVLIVCPGWFMCKDARAFKLMSEDLFSFVDVMTMDFRGHGRSSNFFTFSAKEYLDLKAVVEYAKERYSKVSVMGFSLGGATSIIYASKYKGISALIAVSSPVEFKKIEYKVFKKEAYWPTIEKFELWRCFTIRPGNMFLNKINPIDVVQDISPIPAFFIAGEKDPTVFNWHAEALYEKAGEPKKLEIFEDGFHAEDLYLYSKERFLQSITDFLEFAGGL